MLQDALTWLEHRCRAEAPELLDDVRRVASLAAPTSVAASLLGGAVSLRGDDGSAFDTDAYTDEIRPIPTIGTTGRYVDLGLIGAGGMGEVRRVRDVELNRIVALKRVRPDAGANPAAVARFVEEVQTTAQLQHPSIVPVYDAGRTVEGDVFFTMKEVKGRTLGAVVREVHEGSVERWETTATGWSLRRLVTALHQASQAVAYAHERGVVHRDLKPANLMLGQYGEVQVMDWGLCRVRGREDTVGEQVVVERAREATRMGRVMGTPAYMAPEQALGDIEAIDARTDVYALGAVLYEVLTGGSPYTGSSGSEVVSQVLDGPPPPPSRGDLELPEELVAACLRAMARDPADRYPTATAFADDLQAWLDGSKRRERALEVVAQADATLPASQALRARAAALRAEAEAELATLGGWEPEEKKLAGWAKQEEAEALDARASLKSLERDQLLAASLTYVPDLSEAHAALAEDQRERHAAAEAARDATATTRAEVLLRAHLDALPEPHPVRQRCAAYLRGTGALTLVTDPPGAEVALLRYERHGRRMVAKPVRDLGRTPLVEVPLEMGSYLLRLRRPGSAEVRYPVHIGRGLHWDGVRPGSREPFPIQLPAEGELGPDDCYVPAGWFLAGGRTEYAALPIGTRLWCDACVVRRFPVTNTEYLAFLDDLVARGREEDALRWAPRERAGGHDELGPVIYGRDEAGRFVLRPDADGDLWPPDWPVFLIDWRCATAYASWLAERTGAPWRLPWEFEREKAARGVDGRFMPWGDKSDPSFCNVEGSHPSLRRPVGVDTFPLDESVYGVRGLGGNIQEWCVDVFTRSPPLGDRVVAPFEDEGSLSGRAPRVIRGGFWCGAIGTVRAAFRNGYDPGSRTSSQGFRVARPWPGAASPDRRP